MKYLACIFILWLVIGVIYSEHKFYVLKQKHEFRIATVFNTGSGKNGASLKYFFVLNKDIIYGATTFGGAYTSCHDRFLNKHFVVAYNPEDPTNNYLLLTKKDYKNFAINFPDSMQWVQNLYEW